MATHTILLSDDQEALVRREVQKYNQNRGIDPLLDADGLLTLWTLNHLRARKADFDLENLSVAIEAYRSFDATKQQAALDALDLEVVDGKVQPRGRVGVASVRVAKKR